jgi:hypothetical protein
MKREVGGSASIFEAIGPRLLPDVQVAIIEVMAWTEVPLSATDLYAILDQQHAVSSLSYHLVRLASKKLRVVEIVHQERRRGRHRKWYFFRDREWNATAAGPQLAA